MNLIRKTVSNDRRRYRVEDYDLDLSYITKQILAMGFPASGVEGVFRNHIDDVARFLNDFHPHHYMVFNLSGRKYEESKFNNNVIECGWPDHHSPPLFLLYELCHAMHSWLKADTDNVAVVHCVAGKGRTGTLICAYLLWSGFAEDSKAALNYFAKMRSEKLIGVQYPCQHRILNYFEKGIQISKTCPVGKVYELSKIIFHGIPQFDKENGGCSPFVHILNAPRIQEDIEIGETIYRSDWKDTLKFSGEGHICIPVNRLCKDDILFRFYHSPQSSNSSSVKLMFRFVLNTNFEQAGVVRFYHDDIDLVHTEKNDKIFPELFHVDVILSEPDPKRDYFAKIRGNEGVEKEGWLWKQGWVNTSFKKRLFILKDNNLSYYKSNYDTYPSGSIVLENSKIEKAHNHDRPFCFHIFTSDRVFTLSADDGASLDSWIATLNRAVELQKKKSN